MNRAEIADRAEYVATRPSLVANPKRLMILCTLAEAEMPVTALAASLALSQSALSQHRAKLRGAGMVATRRDGPTIRYRVANGEAQAFMVALYAVFCAPDKAAPPSG